MGGELGIDIKNIGNSGNMVHPFGRDHNLDGNACIDLSIYDKNGAVLHICGNNDWGYLALKMLQPIFKEAENLIMDVKERISRIGDKPEAIILGLNQQRIMDIYTGGKGKCTEIAGIPVARSTEPRAFRYIGNIHDDGISELPFKL